MRSTEREDDERYRSASFAHANHCRQLASNSAFAASSVATRLSAVRFDGLRDERIPRTPPVNVISPRAPMAPLSGLTRMSAGGTTCAVVSSLFDLATGRFAHAARPPQQHVARRRQFAATQ